MLLPERPPPGPASALEVQVPPRLTMTTGPNGPHVAVRIGCNDTCHVEATARTGGREVGLRNWRVTVPAGGARVLRLGLNRDRVAGLVRARHRHVRLSLQVDSRIGPRRVLHRTVALPPPPPPPPPKRHRGGRR
jgi:hypothetical protein